MEVVMNGGKPCLPVCLSAYLSGQDGMGECLVGTGAPDVLRTAPARARGGPHDGEHPVFFALFELSSLLARGLHHHRVVCFSCANKKVLSPILSDVNRAPRPSGVSAGVEVAAPHVTVARREFI